MVAWHRWLRRLAPIVAMAAAVGLAYIIIRPGTDQVGPVPAPALSAAPEAFVLPRLAGGGAVRLSDFRGQPTVVNFFASSCGPCQTELVDFARAAEALKGRVSFVFVDSLDSGNGLATAQQSGVAALPIARDVGASPSSGLHDALVGGPSLPATAFYSPDGRLRQVWPGPVGAQGLRDRLDQLFRTGKG